MRARGERRGDGGTDEGCSGERARRVYNAAVLLTGQPASWVSSTREDNFIKKTKRHAASAGFHPRPVKRPGNKSSRHMETDSGVS